MEMTTEFTASAGSGCGLGRRSAAHNPPMKYAYKVWHSEEHKSEAKKRAGRALAPDEVAWEHSHLATFLEHHHDADPSFQVNLKVLNPPIQGVIIMLESSSDSDAADRWLSSFLVRLNKLEPNLCLIAEPLPRG